MFPSVYQCQARQTISFGRVRIMTPLLRIDRASPQKPAIPLYSWRKSPPGWPPTKPAQPVSSELLATQIKDAQTLSAHGGKLLRGADYDTLEARLTDGHLYHPAYKSRMGFTLNDNAMYAPEIASSVTPLLLAVRRDRCRWAVSSTLN